MDILEEIEETLNEKKEKMELYAYERKKVKQMP